MILRNGFTLVEILLYVSVSSVILGGVSVFSVLLLEVRAKQSVIAEVDGQGMQLIEHLNHTLRNAEGINSPLPGASSSTLSVDVFSVPDDPTVFSLFSGVVVVTEGGGGLVVLTNGRVIAGPVTFSNVSRPGTPGIIRYEFVLTSVNPSGRNSFDYEKTFRGSISLRN